MKNNFKDITEYSDTWNVSEGTRDGKPIFVRLREGLKEAQGHTDFPFQIGVAVPLVEPTSDGLTTEPESKSLEIIEDQLEQAFSITGRPCGVTSGTEEYATQWFNGVSSNGSGEIDYGKVAFDTGKGAIFGKIPLPKLAGVTAGRNSLQAITNSTFTKVGNGTIQNFSGRTGAKVLTTQTLGNTPQSLYNGGSSNRSLQKQIQSLQKQVISILQKKVSDLKKKLGN
jgi:hypothetical protein